MRGIRDGRETIEKYLWRKPNTHQKRRARRRSSAFLTLLDASDEFYDWKGGSLTWREQLRQIPLFRRPRLFFTALVLVIIPVAVIVILLAVRLVNHFKRNHAENWQPPPAQGPFYHEFPPANGFFKGVKSLVPLSQWQPENPWPPGTIGPRDLPKTDLREKSSDSTTVPLERYSPYPPYTSAAYTKEYEKPAECYLDARDTVPVPDVFAYRGIPQNMTAPIYGSYEELGFRNDVCFERFGRFGPYGYGYNANQGGLSIGEHAERGGSERLWEAQHPVDFRDVDWGAAQKRCAQKNLHRFVGAHNTTNSSGKKKLSRTAVLLRAWTGYDWTPKAIMNMRALISELALKSRGEYEVFILLHVKDDSIPIWTSDAMYHQILEDHIPREFWNLTVLWNVPLMSLYYPGPFENNIANIAGTPIHGVYRSAHFAMQWFSQNHPEFDFVWNWEMDMRYSGHYYELLTSISNWTKQQPRKGLWERSSKFWFPSFHGSHTNFTNIVTNELIASGKPPIWGPMRFPVEGTLPESTDIHPPRSFFDDNYTWGVGEDADLITLNPMFDPAPTDWVFRNDITGWRLDLPIPPRRIAIITASRLSRRLLNTMHDEVYLLHHSAFAEMFPSTIALHHGYKAAYAPHPVYYDRNAPLDWFDKTFNHPPHPWDSVFGSRGEGNFGGSSFYYNSFFSGKLWRRWLGQREDEEGGAKEEIEGSEGRMCLRGTLFHPIKYEDLPEE